METSTLQTTENSPKQVLNLKNLIFMGVAVLSFSLKVIYDWDKLVAFSPDVIGGLFLEIAPIIIIQFLALISKRRDFSVKISTDFLKFPSRKVNINNKMFVDDLNYRIIGIPLIALITGISYNLSAFSGFSSLFCFGILIAFLNTFFIWEGVRKIMQTLLNYYPNYQQTGKRLMIEFVLVLFYQAIVTLAIDSFGSVLPIEQKHNSFWISFAIGLTPTLLVTMIYEMVFFFKSWKANAQKLEEMMKNKEVLNFW